MAFDVRLKKDADDTDHLGIASRRCAGVDIRIGRSYREGSILGFRYAYEGIPHP